jgi:two-component system sensor histidine kinase UhpB
MKSSLRILHLEDDPIDAALVKSVLAEEGIACDICQVATRDDFVAAIGERGFDVIFSDYSLPGFDGLSALAISRERCPETPFIFVTGKMGEELAVATLTGGATDYILKEGILRLAPALRRALKEAAERAERRKAVKDLSESHRQLRSLAAHIQSVREEERTLIARDIHDDLGQALTALKMDLSHLAKRLPDISAYEIAEQLKADIDVINATILTVKRICAELRPALLDHLGLGAAIEWQAQEFQKKSGINCEVAADIDDAFSCRPDYSTALFRIFQEALTNIHRHSGATKVHVTLAEQHKDITLVIADNGIGFTEDQLSKANSFGLLGMRERVHICNGELSINSTKNKGTTITIVIPKEPHHRS